MKLYHNIGKYGCVLRMFPDINIAFLRNEYIALTIGWLFWAVKFSAKIKDEQ